ncbi:hypothetical protein JXA40_03260 [bacterium]|nr:hypothetical protein [candidate division CSSED10-310 bacterium]
MNQKFTVLFVSILFIVTGTLAAGDAPFGPEVFSKGIDQLLIDTAHVYVNPSETVRGLYLDGCGAVFTGTVSITSTGGLISPERVIFGIPGEKIKLKIQKSLEDLDMDELSEELRELAIELEKLPETLSELSELKELGIDLSRLAKLTKLAELARLAELPDLERTAPEGMNPDEPGPETGISSESEWSKSPGKSKIIKKSQLMKEDAERLEKMDEHITAFKRELAQTVLDFSPGLKGLKNSDLVAVVMYFREKEFQEKYQTDHLRMQVPYKKLLKLRALGSNDPRIVESFDCNI